jgi:GTP-binding conserved hypothetical protein TIGR00650
MADHGGTASKARSTPPFTTSWITSPPTRYRTKRDGRTARATCLPDAFLLPRGSTPTDLAAKIHSDIAEGYLHAVNGKTDRRISDDYELDDGDVIKIVSTAN